VPCPLAQYKPSAFGSNLILSLAPTWYKKKLYPIFCLKLLTNSAKNGDGNLEILTLSSVVLMQFLKENDLLKQKSLDIKVPSKIWESSTDVQLAFISGYFDADGYASGKKKRGSRCGITHPNFRRRSHKYCFCN
jgi:hypothetical protein